MPPQIALQLYTLRDAFAQDFAGTLDKIAAIGYKSVETAFFPEGVTVQAAAQQIQQAGLTIMAVHCELPLGNEQTAVLEQMATLGCTRMVWHGWPQDADYSSIDGIKRLADRYNHANAVAVVNGYQFGLHNHWWEMEPVAGQYPYQILLAELDAAIFFELDTYWTKTAGRDPVKIVQELGQQAPLLHIKDGPATKEDPMVAVGDGSQDFPAILHASNGNAEWLIVELDRCASDMFSAVERSFHYLVDNNIGQA